MALSSTYPLSCLAARFLALLRQLGTGAILAALIDLLMGGLMVEAPAWILEDLRLREGGIALPRPVVHPPGVLLVPAAWKDTIYIVLGRFRDHAPRGVARPPIPRDHAPRGVAILPIPRDHVLELRRHAEGLIGIAPLVVGGGPPATVATATVAGAGAEAEA